MCGAPPACRPVLMCRERSNEQPEPSGHPLEACVPGGARERTAPGFGGGKLIWNIQAERGGVAKGRAERTLLREQMRTAHLVAARQECAAWLKVGKEADGEGKE